MDVCRTSAVEDKQFSPWTEFSRLRVEKVSLERRKAEYTNEQLRTIAIAKIGTYEVDYRIYTDGSTDGKQTNGGAGVYIEDNSGKEIAEFSEPAGSLCSSYGGECVAMLKACKWIKDREDQEDKPLSILILTDSESLTNVLESRGWKVKDE